MQVGSVDRMDQISPLGNLEFCCRSKHTEETSLQWFTCVHKHSQSLALAWKCCRERNHLRLFTTLVPNIDPPSPKKGSSGLYFFVNNSWTPGKLGVWLPITIFGSFWMTRKFPTSNEVSQGPCESGISRILAGLCI